MRVGVYTAAQMSASYRIYRENVVRELAALGVEIVAFEREADIPAACDLLWNPGAPLRHLVAILRRTNRPVVVTLHGPAPLALPVKEMERRWKDWVALYLRRALTEHRWRRYGERVAALITVSRFAAEEAAGLTHLPRRIIHAIYHGVDHDLFTVDGQRHPAERPYFFHVSAKDQPRKNADRILSAYAQLPEGSRPDLVLISPGYPYDIAIPGVRLIPHQVTQDELAAWYRGALGFLFPSLHETFGMPIIEAMACGCPVVTSNVTACPEVAADAALLVDPRSAREIEGAMRRLMEDQALRERLRQRGLERARTFTWRKSAEEHRGVFEQVACN